MLTYRELAALTENMIDKQKDMPVLFYADEDIKADELFPTGSKTIHPCYNFSSKLILIAEYFYDEDDEYDKNQYVIVSYLPHEAESHVMRLASLEDLKRLNRRIKETKIRLQKAEEELFGNEQSNLE